VEAGAKEMATRRRRRRRKRRRRSKLCIVCVKVRAEFQMSAEDRSQERTLCE